MRPNNLVNFLSASQKRKKTNIASRDATLQAHPNRRCPSRRFAQLEPSLASLFIALRYSTNLHMALHLSTEILPQCPPLPDFFRKSCVMHLPMMPSGLHPRTELRTSTQAPIRTGRVNTCFASTPRCRLPHLGMLFKIFFETLFSFIQEGWGAKKEQSATLTRNVSWVSLCPFSTRLLCERNPLQNERTCLEGALLLIILEMPLFLHGCNRPAAPCVKMCESLQECAKVCVCVWVSLRVCASR